MIYKRKHNKYMIRNRILIVYLLFISISILTGCCINQTVNETELTYGDDLINLVEETMKQEPREENKIGKVNWPHYEGILFNEATGIVVESIFDEFPK